MRLLAAVLLCSGCVCAGNKLKPVEPPEPTPAPAPCVAGAEVCDGKDNDCDGQVDDELMPQLCGMGECSQVQPTCAAGAPQACQPVPGAAEVCDGKDNDCDGSVDEALLSNLARDRRITSNPAASDYVYAGWSGQQFGLVWQDKRDAAAGEIYFAALDPHGARMAPADRRLTTTSGASTHPALAFNGTRWGLVWADDTPGNLELYFQLLEADGTPVGTARRLTTAPNSSDWPDVVWTGSEFVVAWEDERGGAGREDLWLQRLDAAGAPVGGAVQVSSSSGREMDPVLKAGGGELGLVWTDTRNTQREIYFRRLSLNGQLLGGEVRVTQDAADSAWPDLAWNGAGWAVAWHDTRAGNQEIYFTRLDATGAKTGGELRLTDDPATSGYPSIDWNGFEYGVSWQDDRGGKPAIYFAQVSALGLKNGGDVKVTHGSGASSFTTALWNGQQFAFAWRDDRDAPAGNTELYFAYVGCVP